MSRKGQIKIEVLKALNSCHPYAMPEETLFTQVTILVPGAGSTGRLLRSEFDEAVRALESEKQIVGVTGFDGGAKWKISDNGRATLNENGI